MSLLDPYPDLPDPGTDSSAPAEQVQLSEADSRLLDALSRPGPAVVVAVEDQPRTAPVAQGDGGAAQQAAPRSRPLAPVFQEPTD